MRGSFYFPPEVDMRLFIYTRPAPKDKNWPVHAVIYGRSFKEAESALYELPHTMRGGSWTGRAVGAAVVGVEAGLVSYRLANGTRRQVRAVESVRYAELPDDATELVG
jgi:hypothetical protein